MKALNFKQNTPEWLEMRRQCIGASDAPIILGLSPYKTREQLLHEKVYGSDNRESANMTFGKQNEEAGRKLFELMSDLVMFPGGVYAREDRPWQIASIDGIDLDWTNIVEIKCANKVDHAMACEGKVPPKYMAQLQHQISVMGLEGSWYFSYHKEEGKIVWCPRDDDFIQDMIIKELIFLDEMRQKALESNKNNEAVGW